jgi:F-type H+-transporting ATPase subunit b
MDQTLSQVGGLLLGSIPTILLFVLLYLCYGLLVHKPMLKVLQERRERTEGAIEKARMAMASAERRTSEYEQRLREARLTVFKAQESRRQRVTEARAAALAKARSQAQAQVAQARTLIEADRVTAQVGLQAEGPELAGEIIRQVLQPARQQTRVGGG